MKNATVPDKITNVGKLSDRNEGEANKNDNNVEKLLVALGGTFGRFQIFNFIIYSSVIFFCGMNALSYVLTTLNLEYRYVLHNLQPTF